jgi:hypothetical protein
MTIHSDWSRILHEECEEAFSKSAPQCALDIGVIDGHLQLMRLDARMETWECFVRNQFLKPIQTLFNLGCPRVVLCFDNYGAVPVYKTMTQTTRTSKYVIKNFGPQDELPQKIPEDPMQYLMNRSFKLKLIEMLCDRIPAAVHLEEGQEFILDYKRVVSYSMQMRIPSAMRDMETMGESDVKFCRYVSKYGNALVHAIDGDYMAIALLYYTQHDTHLRNQIFIYRQLSVLHPPPSKKRKLVAVEEEQLAFFKPSAPQHQQPPKCWVNMQLVYKVLSKAMRKGLKPDAAFAEKDAVFGAVFLMLLAGTDFSRNTPLLGPKRMWEALPRVGAALLQSVDRREGTVDEAQVMDAVIARMYEQHYSKHVRCSPFFKTNFGLVLQSLQKSKLSEGTKLKLPSPERMLATLRNVRWVVKYWRTENGLVETPEDGHYGYARNRQGELTFVDLCRA